MLNNYLDFKAANCKNCYKCLHDCPVKAITVIGDQARIKNELCVLCGHCANVCRFNAKVVASSIGIAEELLKGKTKVIASLAPAFVSSLCGDFVAVEKALLKLGFGGVQETARGASSVTAEYKKLLDSGRYANLIASACPAIVRLIQIYHPAALKYLAPVVSPMVAHAQLIKSEENAKIIFIGPCIAKKREADESGIIDAVLTFEELNTMLKNAGITIESSGKNVPPKGDNNSPDSENSFNKAEYYPINRGIIKSFSAFSTGYEYISVDGMTRAREVLDNIDSLSGMFIEMHACEFSCINGPCALNKASGGFIKATEKVRAYVSQSKDLPLKKVEGGNFIADYKQINDPRIEVPEYEIKKLLEATGKYTIDDELNCGSCGYPTCREKAKAVYRGMAELEMCVPYMRARAEGLSYDIIQNSPNGILAVNDKFEITEINDAAADILGVKKSVAKGQNLEKFYNPTEFYLAMFQNESIDSRKIHIDKTDKWVELTLRKVANLNMVFCIMKDITQDTDYNNKLAKLKEDTIATTNSVVEKQMRVVQEIAGLLGETAAETKIALLKLKDTLTRDDLGSSGGKA